MTLRLKQGCSRIKQGLAHCLSVWAIEQTDIHPRRPRLVIAMRCLLYEIWGVTTSLDFYTYQACQPLLRYLNSPCWSARAFS